MEPTNGFIHMTIEDLEIGMISWSSKHSPHSVTKACFTPPMFTSHEHKWCEMNSTNKLFDQIKQNEKETTQ